MDIGTPSCETLENIAEYISDIKFCIADFNINEALFNSIPLSKLGIQGDKSNKVFFKGTMPPKEYLIAFADTARNCKVFFDEGVSGKGSRLSIKGDGNIVYVGKNSTLNKVAITLLSKGDFVLVGAGVSVTADNSWSTGFSPGKNNNGIIIGDHCLMASEIIIRPADGHMIMDAMTKQQVNTSHKPIIIEPYCWIGQRSSILKNVRIGACSIVSLGAVVTKSCDRFSALGGVPATARSIAGKMWIRNQAKESKRVQSMYQDRFFDKSLVPMNVGASQNNRPIVTSNKSDSLVGKMDELNLKVLIDNAAIIHSCVESFDIDTNNYNKFTPAQLKIFGDDSNEVYIKGNVIPAAILIAFGRAAKNAKVFIGAEITGKGTKIAITGEDNFLYIGNKCRLNKINLSVVENGDSFIIGDEVTTTAANMWTTGHYSGTDSKMVIIGDDCMFSYDITLRATDGYPIFISESMEQINIPANPVIIEPHCWIGQSSYIGKNVKIGACSIIAANAVVTKSCERFTMLSGVPAAHRSLDGNIWGRNLTPEAKARAKHWADLYKIK
ncbi:putative lipopolysaccharide biosynthesis O-acetyl transferase WbbJ [Yersinia intermedia]|uniref:Putative lipopolysaccharide biosynthesis O-acetyl transferase WbbJ n=1 Tax=Yersinia intermedia TaxID=631 RepID=A0A0H5LX95_YERIN|nr:DapH/DapD/GlmU-related protein [Yersinia intermedia]CRY55794.1 putative lipopolysaccharide biosynthesis O-acetyl transferase WbbJ [Yersinia intermedia]